MAGEGIDLQTDTHLAKKYNDVLYECMGRCNATGFDTNLTNHFQSFIAYYSAVNIFYINTFMLFEQTMFNLPDEADGKIKPISFVLQKWSDEIEGDIRDIKSDKSKQNDKIFADTLEKCKRLHKLIMYGLQMRKMLVRMSESEPRGKDSINYWGTKTGFKKGGQVLSDRQLQAKTDRKIPVFARGNLR